jgi:hypothetical protein
MIAPSARKENRMSEEKKDDSLIKDQRSIALGPNDTAVVIRCSGDPEQDDTTYKVEAIIPGHQARDQNAPLNAVEQVTVSILLMAADGSPEAQHLREHLRDFYIWRTGQAMRRLVAEADKPVSPEQVEELTEGLDISPEDKAMIEAMLKAASGEDN